MRTHTTRTSTTAMDTTDHIARHGPSTVRARLVRRVAAGLASRALAADATQTSLCAWLSAIALAAVALNATVGWW
jgi:hypothetical protein